MKVTHTDDATMRKNSFANFISRPVYQVGIVAVITAIAALLRFYRLGEWSIWIEEYHSLRHAANINSLADVIGPRPVFVLILRLTMDAIGTSEWAARFTPAIIGVISIPVLYGVVKKFFGIPVAVTSAILLAVSPWHLYWSQNARFYTLLLLLFLVSIFAFWYGIEKDRFRYILLATATMCLAAATTGVGAFLILIFLIYYFLLKVLPFDKPVGLRFRNIAPILGLPFLAYTFYEAYNIYAGGAPIYPQFLQFFGEASLTYTGYADPYVMLTASVYYIGTPVAFLAVLGSVYLYQKRSRAGLLLTIGAFTPLLIMMALTLVASTANRYVFMSLPCWTVLAAFAIHELFSRVQNRRRDAVYACGFIPLLAMDPVTRDLQYYWIDLQPFVLTFLIVAAIIMSLPVMGTILSRSGIQKRHLAVPYAVLFLLMVHPLLADLLYYRYQHGHRDNWKAVTSTISQEEARGDVVLSTVSPVAAYYLNLEVRDLDDKTLIAAAENGQRVWLVKQDDENLLRSALVDTWAESHCQLMGNWDQFVAGRMWPMRLYRCDVEARAERRTTLAE